MLSNLKGYRTVIVNGVVALAGVLVAFGLIPAAETVSADQVASSVDALIGGITVAIAVVNFVLRAVTNTSIGAKS